MPFAVRLTPLALALSLLGGCATPQAEAPATPLANKNRFSGATLADLEGRDIVIETGEVVSESAEEAIGNYQTALSLFRDPNDRLETLKRMAELTMQSSMARDLSTDTSPEQPATASSIKGENEEVLYERFMQGMVSARDGIPGQGSSAKPKASQTARVDYAQAVKLYEQLLQGSQPGPDRAEAYYELAKAYDLNGQREESLSMLRKLVDEYPGSTRITEARFRIAESEFAAGRFAAAAESYATVYKADDNEEFRDQAIYKQAWALYKASDYEAAQPLFFQVLEEWQPRLADTNKAKADNARKLLEDTFNIISLGFIQQEGPKSVDAYFQKVGQKVYTPDVYMNLGHAYLGKRLFRNAAETFDFFVAKHPFDPRAPEFSTATIQAFQDGGFPSEVIPAKENFVKHYNTSSEFWAKSDERTRQEILPLLLSHIIDLAKHQHAVAQKTQKPEDYLKAASWYRQHLALNPPEAEALTINQLLAESLFAARSFDDAITEFEKTAYQYPGNTKANEAAYFALLAYLEQEKDITSRSAESQKDWWGRRIASTHKFAAKFPTDKNTPLVLQGLTNDQIANKDLEGAMKTASLILQLDPPAPVSIQKESWMVIADGEFDLGRPEAAEFAYGKVLAYQDLDVAQRNKFQDRLTASVYKQAEKLRDAKDVDGAVAAYKRAASVATDIKFKAGAEFDAATMYLNAERHAEAIPLLVAFRTNFPGNALNDTIPEKLALSYEKTGQLDKAAMEYEGISAHHQKTNAELSRQALLTAADMYEKAGQSDETLRVYKKYIATFPKPVDVNMETQFRLYNAYLKQSNTEESTSMLRELARSFEKAGTENTARTSYLGAMAKFKLSRPIYDEFAGIALKQPLKQSLGRKRQAMQKALDTYSKIASIGVAEFTTASNYQIAEIYRKLASDLMASERPKGLSELEQEQYGFLLEEQATPFEDKALDLYVANANLAKQNIYDDFVRQSFDALAKLSPGRYNKREQSETFIDVIY
jgi:tetratricopeptide (TPR) repeat protein